MPKSVSEKYSKKDFEKDLQELESLINQSQKGGKKKVKSTKSAYTGTYRHFRVVKLNGKEVHIGSAAIKDHHTPLNAARKLLMSIAKHENLSKLKKLGLKAHFLIQETTRGSAHKIFGPYHGKYVKYTAEEAKSAMASGIKFQMKPVVKLMKEKNNAMKGGSKL
jgi:hypothetical protein